MTHLWESDTKGQRERFGRNSKSGISESRNLDGGGGGVVRACQLGMTAVECGEKGEGGCIDIL